MTHELHVQPHVNKHFSGLQDELVSLPAKEVKSLFQDEQLKEAVSAC